MLFEADGSREVELSLVIPVKDEVDNVAGLAEEINASMSKVAYTWECVWVDYGSKDGTLAQL